VAPIADAYWAPMGVRMTYYYRGHLSGMHYVKKLRSTLCCFAFRYVALRYLTLQYIALCYWFFCAQRCVAEWYVALQYVTLRCVMLPVAGNQALATSPDDQQRRFVGM